MINTFLLILIAVLLTTYCISSLRIMTVIIAYAVTFGIIILYFIFRALNKALKKYDAKHDLFPERHNRHEQ